MKLNFKQFFLADITNQQSLELYFDNIQLKDERMKNICEKIEQCEHLTNLCLYASSCEISEEEISLLAFTLEKIPNFINLTICIGNNEIGEVGISHLASAIGKNTHLQLLKLHFSNEFNEKNTSEFGQVFGQLIDLQSLDIAFLQVKLDGLSIVNFVSQLGFCSKLIKLSLEFEQYISQDVEAGLINGIKQCKHLIDFTFYYKYSSFSLQNLSDFLSLIGQYENLTHLNLQMQLVDFGIDIFSQTIPKLKKLTKLTIDLSSTKFTYLGALSIGSGLGQCTNITNLQILFGQNYIVCQDLGYGLRKCQKLQVLHLSINEGYYVGYDGERVLKNYLLKYIQYHSTY